MVKLRVTARILPEDDYLAHPGPETNQPALIRGEKRFHVVIQDPEKWYIGTLAVAVREKYQNLYRHDLGQIKYLKDNEDDCDLDPEELVSDLLVNEGKALTDKSDQHVTIKVVREQGRAIRQDSVVPDLTPVHYRLPTKPTVPRFEEVESVLGKRKDDNAQEDTEASKRRKGRQSQMQQIEAIVPSVEDIPNNELLVHNSQSPQNDQVPQRHHDLESGWSFSQVGLPRSIEQQKDNNADSHFGTRVVKPVDSKSPDPNRSSASKRFLKPSRDIYAIPDSDIDDSQRSPRPESTSKTTPPIITGTAESDQTPSRKPVNPQKQNRKAPVAAQRLQDQAIKGKDPSAQSAQTPKMRKTAPTKPVQQNSPEDTYFGTKKANLNKSKAVSNLENIQDKSKKRQLSTPPPDSPSEQLSQALQESTRKLGIVDVVNSQTSTADKQETLSQNSLMPSTKQATINRPVSPKPLSSKAVKPSAQNQNSTEQNGLVGKRKRRSKTHAPQTPQSVKASQTNTESTEIDPQKETKTPAKVLTQVSQPNIPIKDQLSVPKDVREASVETSVTKSSIAVLPPGMSQAEFDRIVANNVHLNMETKKPIAKKRSTTSLGKSESKDSNRENFAGTTQETPDQTRKSNSRTDNEVTARNPTTSEKSDFSSLKSSAPGSSSARDNASSNKPSTEIVEPKINGTTNSEPKKPMSERNTVRGKHDITKTISTPKLAGEKATDLASQNKTNKLTTTPSRQNESSSRSSSAQSIASGPRSVSRITSSTPKSADQSMPPPGTKSVPRQNTTPKTATAAKESYSKMPTIKSSNTTSASKQNHPTLGQTKTKPPTSGPASIYEARSLKDLKRISTSAYNSASTSTAASPASKNRTSFLSKSKSIFDNQDDDDESSDESSGDDDSTSSSSGNNTKNPRNAIARVAATTAGLTSGKGRSSPVQKPSGFSTLATRPDPTIRDASADEDSGNESGSSTSD